MTDAWLFDCYPHPRKSLLVLWIKLGHRVFKRHVEYVPEFCIKSEAQPLEAAEKLLAADDRVESFWRDNARLWLRGPEEPVVRVRPRRLQDLHRVATDLRKATASKGFLFFDVDHQPESRWLHSQGLFHLCRLDSETMRLVPGEDRWTVEYPDPGLVVLRLEVKSRQAGPERSWTDALESIRLGDVVLECPAPGDPGAERAVLREFGRRLQKIDPDVIVTRHGDRFDVPFLLRRIRDLDLHHHVWLGRESDPHPDHPDQESKSIHTYGRWLHKTHAYYLRGRWHIDLSKKTLDSEDDRKDLHGILYLARVSNRRAQDVNRNGAGYALQQMQIDEATDRGVALPWKRNLAEDWKDAATLCAVDRGGQIMVPEPGIYEDVAACDFSGYYPSLVVMHNLSSDTINCVCCPDAPLVPELGFHVCQQVAGHQSTVLKRLWPHRRWAKAALLKAKAG